MIQHPFKKGIVVRLSLKTECQRWLKEAGISESDWGHNYKVLEYFPRSLTADIEYTSKGGTTISIWGIPDAFLNIMHIVPEWVQGPRRQAQIPDSDMIEAHEELDCICEGGEPMSAPEFLLRAVELFEERGEEYDVEEERSMGKTVVAFNAITGHNLKESEGWLLVQLLKDVRQWTKESFHRDSAEDCISYAALKAEALAEGK